MGNRIRVIVAFLAFGAFSGCGGFPAQQASAQSATLEELESDVARSVDNAMVFLPRGAKEPLSGRMGSPQIADALARVDSREPLATLIYMHGCTGLGDFDLLNAVAQRGFAVVAPDSFARRYRPMQCDPKSHSGGRNVFVFDFRITEVSYTLHRLRQLPWVDHHRMFLAGTSEGGVAAALYRGDDFRARVIAQWTCQGAPLVRGLAAPLDEPVLAVVRADDPWYDPRRTPGQKGDCGAYMNGRPRSESVILRDGPGHNVFDDPKALGRVLDFLTEELLATRKQIAGKPAVARKQAGVGSVD
jgi:dienelactone hydrolase